VNARQKMAQLMYAYAANRLRKQNFRPSQKFNKLNPKRPIQGSGPYAPKTARFFLSARLTSSAKCAESNAGLPDLYRFVFGFAWKCWTVMGKARTMSPPVGPIGTIALASALLAWALVLPRASRPLGRASTSRTIYGCLFGQALRKNSPKLKLLRRQQIDTRPEGAWSVVALSDQKTAKLMSAFEAEADIALT